MNAVRWADLLKYFLAALFFACFYNDGYAMSNTKRGVSDNLSALKKFADLPVQAHAGRWEIFSTPEDDFVPGPSVATTLIAELVPLNPVSPPDSDEKVPFLVMPEAARPWLSKEFHALMKAKANQHLTLGKATRCHLYQSRIGQSTVPVKGFVCFREDRVLMYLRIMSD